VKLVIQGSEELLKALEGKKGLLNRAIARGVTKGAIIVQGAARMKILKGPRSGKGREYKRGKKTHVASAPGEPPANDTGNLARSVAVVVAQPGVLSTAYVNVGAPYGADLEFGTRNMEPRPFLQPSLDENAAKVGSVVQQELEAVVKS
jgi:HK97 gp10 family phage protein